MNVIQSFLVPSPRDLPYSAVFNTCWHLYFLDIMLKLEQAQLLLKLKLGLSSVFILDFLGTWCRL